MNTVIVIIAHGKPKEGGSKDPQEMFDRNIRLWERLNTPIIVVSPVNSQVKTQHKQISFGESARWGPQSIARVKTAIGLVSQYDFGIVSEADGICLCKKIEWLPGFHTTVQPNHLKQLSAKCYPMWPMMMDRATSKRLVDYADSNPEVTGGYWADRYVGELAHFSKITLEQFNEPVCIVNTIEKSDYPTLKYLLENGCCWIHGVKTEECLKFILEHWKDNPWK